MISIDSLQVLENPMVQAAITDAHDKGFICGLSIGFPITSILIIIIAFIYTRNQRIKDKENTLWKYRRMKMELCWIDMIKMCKECLEGDIRIAKITTNLFKEFPGYDDERREIEVQHFPGVAQAYQGLIDDRSTIVNTLQATVDRDMRYIKSDIDLIEQQYPEETSQYKNEIE